jgi:hypothetical protein
MSRIRDRRLQRLAERYVSTETEAEQWRAGLEARLEFCRVLREMLAELGVDPAQVRMLRVCDEAAAELAAGPPRALIGGKNAPADALALKLEDLAGRYRDDPTIDFADASLMQVFAWCAGRLGLSFAEDDDVAPAANPLQKQRQQRARSDMPKPDRK